MKKIMVMVLSVFFLISGFLESSVLADDLLSGEIERISEVIESQVDHIEYYLYIEGVNVNPNNSWTAKEIPLLMPGEYTLYSIKVDAKGRELFSSWAMFEVHAGIIPVVNPYYWIISELLLENEVRINGLPTSFLSDEEGEYSVVLRGDYGQIFSTAGTIQDTQLVISGVLWNLYNPILGIEVYNPDGKPLEFEFGQYNLAELVETGEPLNISYEEPRPLKLEINETMGYRDLLWQGVDDQIIRPFQQNLYSIQLEPGNYTIIISAPQSTVNIKESIGDPKIGIWYEGEKANFSNIIGSVLIQDNDNGEGGYEVVNLYIPNSGEYQILVTTSDNSQSVGFETGGYYFRIKQNYDGGKG